MHGVPCVLLFVTVMHGDVIVCSSSLISEKGTVAFGAVRNMYIMVLKEMVMKGNTHDRGGRRHNASIASVYLQLQA